MPKERLLKYNKYMVVGPGRTGSKLIVDYIRMAYYKNNLLIRYFDPTQNIECLPKHFFVWHHHSIENYQDCLKSDFSKITKVLSIRNMVDSTYSRAIVNRTTKFHLYFNQTVEVIPFHLPVDEFLFTYNNIVSFYDGIKSVITDDTIIIDYLDYCNNYDHIANTLNLPKVIIDSDSRIPKKNLYSSSDWIINYKEIEELSMGLSKFPNLR